MALTAINDATYILGKTSDVWSALTSPEKIPLCYWGSQVEGEWKVGSTIAYVGSGAEGEKTRHCWGEVLELQPNKVLSHAANVKNGQKPTKITYKLESVNPTCTKLIIVDDGWENGSNEARERSVQSWKMILSQVKTVVETGKMLNTSPETPPAADASAASSNPAAPVTPDSQKGKSKRKSNTPTSTEPVVSPTSTRPKRGKN